LVLLLTGKVLRWIGVQSTSAQRSQRARQSQWSFHATGVKNGVKNGVKKLAKKRRIHEGVWGNGESTGPGRSRPTLASLE
jgi:hypothetical protein